EIYLSNLRMQIHCCSDGGRSLQNDSAFESPQPSSDGLNGYDVANIYEGERGIYVSGSPLAQYILFKANGSSHFTKIPTPSKHIIRALEVASGILLWRNGDGLFRNDELYFTNSEGGSYKEMDPPASICEPSVADYKNSMIRFACGIYAKKSIYEGSAL